MPDLPVVLLKAWAVLTAGSTAVLLLQMSMQAAVTWCRGRLERLRDSAFSARSADGGPCPGCQPEDTRARR
jgi:hypothetical protein